MSDRYQPPQDVPEGQHHEQPQHGAQLYAPQGQPQSAQGPQPSIAPPGQPPYGPPPYGPPPGGYPQYGGQQQPGPPKGSGLAISALVLGTIALLLCWVPIVNNFAAILAVVGLAFGAPALISARRGKRAGSGLAVGGVILSVLALAGVLATQAFYSSVIDDVTNNINSAAPLPPSSSDSTGGADDAASAAAAAVLPLGQAGQLTEYTVSVDWVTPNGNDIVAAENQFNSPPAGQYVLVGLTVTYNGADEGDPWLDLSTEFIGTDARKYDTSSCSAVIPNEASDLPTLLAGGTATYQVCMDVPPTAIAAGQVEVSESFSFDDVSAVWAIQ